MITLPEFLHVFVFFSCFLVPAVLLVSFFVYAEWLWKATADKNETAWGLWRWRPEYQRKWILWRVVPASLLMGVVGFMVGYHLGFWVPIGLEVQTYSSNMLGREFWVLWESYLQPGLLTGMFVFLISFCPTHALFFKYKWGMSVFYRKYR